MQEDIIKDIRKRCRLAMNGVTSTSMRQRGMVYKVNFGLANQQIKDLASNYEPDINLAETIWKENTRELKILATLLYPINKFTQETAEIWVTEIPNQEIREQVCINLFQNLSYASQLVTLWGNNKNDAIRTTSYWLLARLLLTKRINEETDTNLYHFVWEDVISEDIFLRNAALLALKQIGRQSKEKADSILQKLSSYKNSTNLLEQEIYNSLEFEFEYYH